jgi:hypothetical protein
VRYNPAAASKLQCSGTGCNSESLAQTLVAYAPCAAPKTLSPLLKRARPLFGTEITTPANSNPATQGNGGCYIGVSLTKTTARVLCRVNYLFTVWYLPLTCNRSKKFAAQAWISIWYCSGSGIGSGWSDTAISSTPYGRDFVSITVRATTTVRGL